MAETCVVRTALEPVRRSSREKKQNVCSMYEYEKISLSSKKKDRIRVSPDGRNTRSSTDNYGRKQKNISAKRPRLKQQRYEKSSRKCVEASQTSVKEVFGDEIHKSGTKTSSWVTGPVGREESPMCKCCPESPGAGKVSVASQAECGIPWGPSQQDVPVGGRKQQAVSAGAKGLHDVSAEAKDQQDVPVGCRKQQAVSAGAKGLHYVSAEAKDQQDVPAGGRKQQAVSAGAKGLHDVSAEAKEQQDVPVGAREQVVRSDEMSDEVQEARLVETSDPECKDLLVAKLQLSPVKMSETDTHAGNQLGKKILVNAYSDRSSDSPTKVISGSERSSLTTNGVLQRRKSDRNHQKKNVDESCLTDSFLSLNEYEVSRIQSPSEYASTTPVRSSEDKKDQDGSFLIKKGTQNFRRKRSVSTKYFCSYCGKVFINQSLLVTHERCHSGEKPYPCSICGQRFALKSNMHQHKQLHSEDRPFMCEVCGKCFKTRSYCREHSKTHLAVKSYKCEVADCGKTFSSKSNHQAHMLFHRGEKPYDCKHCHRTFRRKQALKKHLLVHSGIKKFECLSCGKTFVQQGSYHAHVLLHEKKPFSCGVCKKFFASEEKRESHQLLHTRYPFYNCEFCHRHGMNFQDLSKHLKKHGLQILRNIKCPDCRRSFTTQNIFEQHTAVMSLTCSACGVSLNSACVYYSHRKSHRNDPHVQHDHILGHVCDVCGKDFQKISLLKNHKLIHGDTRFRCDTCGKESKTKPCHMAHVKTHSGLKPFCCEVCGKYFVSHTNLQNHQLIHMGEKPHCCHICSKSFRTRALLREHGNVHSNEKRFKCELCGKEYTSRTNYINHLNVHKGKRNYECEHCGKKFFAKYVMRKHIQIHTGQKNYQCDFCGKKFIQHGNWLIHRRSHTGERPHRCQQCPACFVNSSQLKSHRKRVHDQKKEEMCDKCFKHFYDRKGLLSHMKNVHVRKENGEIFSCHKCDKLFVSKENYRAHEGVCKVSKKPLPRLQPSILQSVLRTVYSKASMSSYGVKEDAESMQSGQLLKEKDFLFQFESVKVKKDKELDRDTELPDQSLPRAAQQFHLQSLSGVDNDPACLAGDNIEIVEISEAVIEADLSSPKVEVREDASIAPLGLGQAVVDTEVREDASVAPVDMGQAVVDTEIGLTEEREDASVSPVDIGSAVVDTEIGLTEVEVSDAVVELTLHEVEIKLEDDVLKSTVQPLQRPQAQKGTESVESNHLAYSKESTERIKSCSVGNEVMGNTRTESLHRCDIVNLGSNEPLQGATVVDAGTLSAKETNDTQCTGSFHVAAKITKPSASWTMSKSSSMFQCDLCKKVLVSGREAMLHEKLHQADLLYQCSLCGVRFGTAASLTSHLQTHSQVKGHQENTAADGGRSTYIHSEGCRRGMTRTQNYSCDICHKGFSFIGLFKLHTESHRVSCCLKCYRCGRIFQDRRIFDCHIQSHSGKGFKCGACGKMFSMEAVLKIHQKRHNCHGYSPKMIKNSTWPLQHAKNDGLKMRFNEHGAIRSSSDAVTPPLRSSDHVTLVPVDRENISGTVPICMCGVCDATYSREEDLVRHKQVHMAGVKYLCQICDLHFDKEVAFRNHIKLHGEVVQVGMGNTECG